MLKTKIIEKDNPECIKDIAFNWHGTCMAVCSNNTVDIWELNQEKQWVKDDSPITLDKYEIIQHLSWAHPEFGQVLCVATSNVIIIYECKSTNDGLHWSKKGSISEPQHFVINDVKFCPSYSGLGKTRALHLAYCTGDRGYLKVKQCKDASLLKDWDPITDLSTKYQLTCLAWNVSKRSTMIAVGAMESSAKFPKSEVQLYEFDLNQDVFSIIGTISSSLDSHVHDISFAPNPGRSFNTLAIAYSDLQVVDFVVTELGKIKVIVREMLEQNKVEVWKVSWSILGTTLCTTGDDGILKLWKKSNKWECLCSKTIKWNGLPS